MLKKNLSASGLIIGVCARLKEKDLIGNFGGNISLRAPGGRILITPALSSLTDITEDALVLCEAGGGVVMGETQPSREFDLHSALYAADPAVGGIIHTHTSLLTAFAHAGRAVTLYSPEAQSILKNIPLIKPQKDREKLKSALAAAGVPVMLLERHGVIAVAKTLKDAVNVLELAVEAARMTLMVEQVEGLKSGAPQKKKTQKK